VTVEIEVRLCYDSNLECEKVRIFEKKNKIDIRDRKRLAPLR
jgi:hypothetical protein